MGSPFPGMDPYIEGWLWPDFHHSLASAIRDQLARAIPPQYMVLIETRLVEDDHPEQELGIMYPDIHVRVADAVESPLFDSGVATIAAPLTLPLLAPTTVRVPTVRIRLRGSRTLVTSIEIISPVNKRGAGLSKFRDKWRQLHRGGVHLVDIDLVRRGRRIFEHVELIGAPYLVTVTRAGRPATEAWPIGLREPLPRIPIPLLAEDPDGVVDLQQALEYIQDMGRYASSLDYGEPPPPPLLTAEDAAWAQERVDAWRAARNEA